MTKIDTQFPLWEVFIQAKSGTPHKHAGSVHAADKEMALQNARDTYSRRSEGTNIWVVPAEFITASSPEDQGAFLNLLMTNRTGIPLFTLYLTV